MTIAFTALSDSRFWSRHVLLSGPKLQNTNCTDTFSTAVTRRKQQASGRLRTANNIIVKCFFQIHAPGKCFISSIMSKFWWYSTDGMRPIDNRSRQVLLSKEYLTLIPQARMGSESIAHEVEGRMGYWLRGHEGERNNCFSKIQRVGQKYGE